MYTSIVVGLVAFGLVMFYGSNKDWPVNYYLSPGQVNELKRRWKKEFRSLEIEMNSLDQLSRKEKRYVGQLKQFFIDELTILLARAKKMQGDEEGK